MISKILLLLYLILFVIFSFKILKKEVVFALVYILLLLYSICPLAAYCLFPVKTALLSGGQYYGEKWFFPFYWYLFGFMFLTYMFFELFLKIKQRTYSYVRIRRVTGGKIFFWLFCFAQSFYCLNKIQHGLASASYENQRMLKGNKIWFFLFEFLGIVLLILISDFIRNYKEKKKIDIFTAVYIFFDLLLYLITAFAFGQRIELFMFACGLVCMLWEQGTTLRASIKKNWKKIGIAVLGAIFFFQIVRGTRGNTNAIREIDIGLILHNTIIGSSDLQFWLFQDWRVPALSLLTCMRYEYRDPLNVIAADFLNNFSFITGYSVSMTSNIKAFFDTDSIAGYGIYFATEGYLLVGEFGFLVSSILIASYYRFFKMIYEVGNDRYMKSYIEGLFGFYAITFVRGYSLYFIKGFLYYIVPGLTLYWLLTGRSLVFRRRENANKCYNGSL